MPTWDIHCNTRYLCSALTGRSLLSVKYYDLDNIFNHVLADALESIYIYIYKDAIKLPYLWLIDSET
jgi:hypothetical protein